MLQFYTEKYESALNNATSNPVYALLGEAGREEFVKRSASLLKPPKQANLAGYFEYVRRNDSDKVDSDCEAMGHLRSNANFSEGYLASLCKELDHPTSGFAADVQHIVRDVPRLFLFDTKFQGAAGRRLDLGLCIVEYPHLASVLQYVTKLIHYSFYAVEGDRIRDRQAWEIAPLFDDPHFHHGLQVLTAWISEKTYKISYSEKLEPLSIHQSTVEYCAELGKQFVRLHETFHLLLGHLEEEQTKQMELDADAYAFALLTLHRGGGHEIPIANGVCAFFLCDYLLENGAESSSHPTALERVSALSQRVKSTRLEAEFHALTSLIETIKTEKNL